MRKDSGATLPFTVDWTLWLAEEQVTAASFTWTVPDGLTKANEAAESGRATVWGSGGTAKRDYPVVCRMTTTGGRIDERTLNVRVREL